ncbi:cob(I)yrinic acid a,c-diamide adenosyltransferase [Anaerolineales bacterium]
MKIYTKTGDAGLTSLFSGGRVAKHHLRVEAYGTVDELNSILGMVRAQGVEQDEWLEKIQNQLFFLGSDLATPLDAKADWITRIQVTDVEWLEASIDEMTAGLEPLKNFILPGGSLQAATTHLGRTVCRRAERVVTQLLEEESLNEFVLPYINRLSDWLFTYARWLNQQAGISESKWATRS